MKKVTLKKVALILLVGLILFIAAGCGSSAPKAPAEQAKTTGKVIDMIRIGTASMTGNNYAQGSAMAAMFNEKLSGMKAASQATGGSADNCNLLDKGEVEIALVQSATAKEAATGSGAFKDHKVESMRGIGVVAISTFHVLVNNKSGIEKIADIKGKKVGVGPMGGGVEVNAKILLSEYGVGAEDFKSIYGTMGEALEAVKLGQVDAVVYATSTGTANVSDVLASGNAHLIGMTAEEAKGISAKRSEFGVDVIPADTYKNQPQAITTIAGTMLLLTTNKYSDESIYKITKAIYEQNAYLVAQNAIFKQALPKNAPVGMCVPFHPGAEKYLKEVGVLK